MKPLEILKKAKEKLDGAVVDYAVSKKIEKDKRDKMIRDAGGDPDKVPDWNRYL